MKQERKNHPEHQKISVAVIANNLEMNGISSVIMNYCSLFDFSKVAVTLFVGEAVAENHQLKCDELGINVIQLPHRKKSTVSFYKKLFLQLRQGTYDIAHVHGSHAAIAVELVIAMVCGIKVRIAHSHNTTCMNMKAHKLMKPIFRHAYTHKFACGSLAGQWLFGEAKDVFVMKNGFNTEKFRFDIKEREKLRNQLNIEHQFVLGHIGRFNSQKNHKFLLQIFEQVAKKRDDAVLLLVGDGANVNDIKHQIEQHPFKERIILYGETATPEKLYMAMDVFVFPSLFEGLPVTLLEAQISGLPCVISDVITKEVMIQNRVVQQSLEDSYEQWAMAIVSAELVDRYEFYKEAYEEIQAYDIQRCAEQLMEQYAFMVKNRKRLR